MRSDLLLDRLDTLVGMPEDVAKLESAILDLAVRGQLVGQDLEGEAASVLVERIKAAKKSLAAILVLATCTLVRSTAIALTSYRNHPYIGF